MGVSWTKETISNSGTAGTTTAESLTIDNIKIDGVFIGHTSDTDLMRLSSGALLLNGSLTVGTSGNGSDVKFWGATAANYLLWDVTADADFLHIKTTHNENILLLETTATRSGHDAPDITIYKNSNANTTDYLGALKFNSKDAGGGQHTFAEIDTYAQDATAGGEEGALFISVLANATATQSLKCIGAADGLSDVQIPDGRLTVGTNTVTQGILDIKRKDANEFSYIKMYSADGTASYLFVANNGTLRIHSAAPTANTDGSAV